MALIQHLGTAVIVVFVDYLLVLTDCIIAGRVIGETALGAMNLLIPVFSIASFLTWLLASGVSSIYQLSMRRREGRRSAEIAFQGIAASILLALALVAALFCCRGAYLAFMGPNEEISCYFRQYLTWYPAIVSLQSVGMTLLYLVFVRGGQLVCVKGVNIFRDVADCNPTGQDRLTFIYQDEWGELMSPGPVREDGPYAWMIEETIPLAAPRAATENPFNVEIMEHRDATRLFVEYDTGSYAESTARRYAELFRESLAWLLAK